MKTAFAACCTFKTLFKIFLTFKWDTDLTLTRLMSLIVIVKINIRLVIPMLVWNCRVIVNAWGMFAVVFIAGYTANLASFMAGRMLDPNIDISKVNPTYTATYILFSSFTSFYLGLNLSCHSPHPFHLLSSFNSPISL